MHISPAGPYLVQNKPKHVKLMNTALISRGFASWNKMTAATESFNLVTDGQSVRLMDNLRETGHAGTHGAGSVKASGNGLIRLQTRTLRL